MEDRLQTFWLLIVSAISKLTIVEIHNANASGVKKWPLPSVRSKYSNITTN